MFRVLGLLLCLWLSIAVAPVASARPLCTVYLSSPSNGQTLVTPPSLSVVLSGSLTCEEPMNVTIYDNGQAILYPGISGGGFNYTFSATWNNVPVGVHHLSATVDGAYDSATSDGSVIVTVLPPATGTLSASPQVCNIPAGASTCGTTIGWTSNRSATGIWVTGPDNSNPQQFSGSGGATSGSQAATWIGAGIARFHLRENVGSTDLAAIDVHGNLPPDVALSGPSNGSNYYVPANVAISANASDPDGNIQRVEFRVDGNSIGAVYSAPYQLTWSNAGGGSHTIQAIAFDNLGNSRWSPISTVTGLVSSVTGNIDGVTSDGWITGWACSTYWSQSINVDLYLGGPYGSGTFIGRYLANQSSEPAVASACGVGGGSYRFSISLSEAQRLQYGGRAIDIHGLSPLGGGNNLLAGSGNFVVPVPISNAQFIGQSVNTAMQTGSSQTVTVQYKNTGTRTWTSSAGFKLGSRNPFDNGTWGTGRVALPGDIAPGQIATFTFPVQAPSTPGSYNFQWGMLQEGVAWFGDVSANVAVTVSVPPPVVSVSSSTDYDELGRVIARRDSAGNIKVSYVYDANGNVIRTTDALNRSTDVQYDALNRPVASTDAAGGVTHYEYDLADNLTKVVDPRGNATTYTYDGFAQLWMQVSPDTGVTSYTYDASGLRTSMTRNDGSALNYSYDTLGRVTSIGNAQAQRSYSYDNCTNGKGRLCSMNVDNGTQSWSNFTYNPDGQLTARDDGVQGTENWTGYSYDGQGRLTGISYPSGVSVAYVYAYGKLSSSTVTVNAVTSNLATGLHYQPFGPVTDWTVGNGLARSYGYDSDGRLTGVSTGTAGGLVQSLTYGFNSGDEITAITNGVNTGLSEKFTYDVLSRLTKQEYGSGGQQLRDYDATGNLTHNIGPWDEYLGVDQSSNRVANMGPHIYGYDARGNRSRYQFGGSTATYAYDAFNRLSQYSRDVEVSFGEPNGPNGEGIYHPAGTWSYLYDAQDQRVGKSGPDGQARYIYGAPGQLLAEYGPSGWKSYLWLGRELVGVYSSGAGLNYIHTDHLGRPEVVTNGAQLSVWRAANYAFGRTVTQNLIGGLNLGFPGQYLDAESGLWQNGFRDYDSRLGRYLENDPIGLMGGINVYTYANNNPVQNVDPLGLRALTECEKDALKLYIPEEDLNNADLHDGEVPRYLGSGYDGITRGNDIYFRPGVYDSSTPSGIALLGHELVHVGQYRQGMTWVSYLWSTRHGYENSKYEKPAYAMQAQIQDDLGGNGFSDCGCKK